MPDGVNFCPYCGAEVYNSESQNKEIPESSSVSMNDQEYGNTTNPKKMQNEGGHRKSKKLKIGLGIFVALLFIGMMTDIFGEDESSKENRETETTVISVSGEAVASEVSEDHNIKRAEAVDEYDLTGTYQDYDDKTENKTILSLIVEGDSAAYSLVVNDAQPMVEQNCTIESGSITGRFYYIVTNFDGSLAISSGVGAPWGKFVKISDSAEIDLSYDLAIAQENAQAEFESLTPLEKLRSRAIEDNCNNEIIDDINADGENMSEMGDDGSYFDEVMLGSWFYEDGTPKAKFPPLKLQNSLIFSSNIGITFSLEDFDFINVEEVSITDVKRRGTDGHWYAIVLLNIQKGDDGAGNMYFTGLDPISNEVIVVHGNFESLLNGDDLLVFGRSMGTASDDTLNLEGVRAENISSRVEGLF